MAIYLEALDSVIEAKRAEALGQYDLFGSTTGDEVTGLELKYPIEEWDKSTLLAHEREMLGLYVSDHPLLGIESTLAALVDRPISEISGDEVGHDDIVTIGGPRRSCDKSGSDKSRAMIRGVSSRRSTLPRTITTTSSERAVAC